MAREINVRFLELGVRTGQVGGTLADAGPEGRDILRAARLAIRIPAETLHIALILRQLHDRIGVVLGVVEVVDLVQVTLVEEGV